MKDWLGLEKVDQALAKLDFNIFKEPKQNFLEPKPKYTNKARPNYTREIKEVKKIMKSTGSSFGSAIEKIRNRKIHKLEKEALKAKAKADQLAHEIKTKQALIDSLTDIQRYEKEKEKVDQELKETKNKGANNE